MPGHPIQIHCAGRLFAAHGGQNARLEEDQLEENQLEEVQLEKAQLEKAQLEAQGSLPRGISDLPRGPGQAARCRNRDEANDRIRRRPATKPPGRRAGPTGLRVRGACRRGWDANKAKSADVRALLRGEGLTDPIQLHVWTRDAESMSVMYFHSRRFGRRGTARHAADKFCDRGKISDRAHPRVGEGAGLAEFAIPVIGRIDVQPRLPGRERERGPDAGLERIRPPEWKDLSLLQHRVDVRRVGSRRGPAPRRYDLASLESLRRDAGGPWREMEP